MCKEKEKGPEDKSIVPFSSVVTTLIYQSQPQLDCEGTGSIELSDE